MKKIYLSLAVLAAATISLQAENVLVGTQSYMINVAEDGTETATKAQSTQNYYNDQLQNHISFANGFITKKYDEQGRLSTETYYNNNGGVYQKQVINEYDEEGNLVKVTTKQSWGESVTEYSNFENGVATHTAITQNEQTTETDIPYTFNEAGQILRTVSNNTLSVYTYNEAGQLEMIESEWIQDATLESELDPASQNYSKKVYSYNEDGTLKAIRSISTYSINEEQYIYADIKGEWAPQNVTAEASAEKVNVICLQWDAVADAEGYLVSYPKSDFGVQADTVWTNAYETITLVDGSYSFMVQPIFGGEAVAAASNRVLANVKDESKTPATDFTVARLWYEETENSWGGLDQVYVVECKWNESNPDKVSARKLSYGASEWDVIDLYDVKTFADGTCMGKANISIWTALNPDENWEYNQPKDLNTSIVLTYATGAADKSNEVVVNCMNEAIEKPEADALQKVETSSNASVYSIDGQRHQGALTPGFYVVGGKKIVVR